MRARRGVMGVVFLWGSLVGAEEPIREQTGVSVVEVPVYVLGSDGLPVTDLREVDFTVYEDGKKQAILFVEPVRAVSRQVPAGSPTPAAVDAAVEKQDDAQATSTSRRHFVLVFDLVFTDPDGFKRAVKTAWTFINEQALPEEPVAMFTISRAGGLMMKTNFTTDRALLAQSLATIGSTERKPDSLRSGGLYDREAVATSASQSVGGRTGAPSDFFRGLEDSLIDGLGGKYAANYDHLFNTARLDRTAYRITVQDYLASLGELAASLDVVPGSKHVFLMTSGFDLGQAIFNNSGTVGMLNNDISSGETIDTTLGRYDDATAGKLQAAMERLSTADCRFYLFETAAVNAPGDVSNDSSMADPQSSVQERHASLDMMADRSGGKAYKNRNDLRGPIDDVLRETSYYYVLAYAPQATKTARGFHSIRVDVSRPGVKVTHRRGYQESRPFGEYSKLERDLHLARLLNLRQELPGIPFAAQALSFPTPQDTPDGRRDTLVQIALPSVSLIQAGSDPLELYAFAQSASGDTSGFIAGTVSLSDPALAERARQAGLTHSDGMRLAPGCYRLRVIVRDSRTGVSGARDLDLVVAGGGVDFPQVASPCFLSAGTATINQRGPSFQPEGGLSYPVTFGSRSLVAAVEPSLAPGQSVPLLLKVANAPIDPVTGRPRISLTWRVVNEAGDGSLPAHCELVNVSAQATGISDMIFSFTAPDMKPGIGLLEITATRGDSDDQFLARVPFKIAAHAGQ